MSAGPQEGLARRAGAGMAWGQFGKAVEVGLSFAIAVVAIRALQPAQFGAYSVLTNLAGVGGALLPVVTSEALGAVFARFEDARERLSLVLVVALVRWLAIAVVIAAALPFWTTVRDGLGVDGVATATVVLIGGYWLAQDLLNTITGFYFAEMDLRSVVVAKTAGQILTLVALLGLVAAGEDGIGSVLAVVAAGYALGAGMLVGRLVRARGVRRPAPDRVAHILGFTRDTWLVGVLSLGLTSMVGIPLVSGLTDDAREAAYYATAVGVVARAQFVFMAGWSSLIIPAFGAALVRQGAAGLAWAWRVFAQLWLLVALPANTLLLVLAEPLVTTVGGDAYAPGADLLRVTAALNIVESLFVGPPSVGALWALDRQGALVRVRMVTAPLGLALAVPLISAHGAMGAVVGIGAASAATAAAELVIAARAGTVRYPVRAATAFLAASALAAAPALVIGADDPAEMVAAAFAGMALFAAACLAIRPFGPEDLAVLRQISPRIAASPVRRLMRP
jgi:O-antigen/teichoic acid export membrane protein